MTSYTSHPSPFPLRLNSFLDFVSYLFKLLLDLLALGLGLALCALQAILIHQYPSRLCRTGEEQEEVYGGEEDVLGPDDEAPTRPDEAGSHECSVRVEGKLGRGASEVRGTGDDDTPFHYGSPEMHRLRTNRALP